MAQILTISGKAEHGKDSTATILKSKLELAGKKVLIMHYADLLKFYCTQYFEWDGQKDNKGRTLLQYIGTEKVRERYPNYWVERVINFVDIFHTDFDYFIISDCRFPNECDLWIEHGYDIKTIHVERIDFSNSLTPEQRQHRSETSLDDYTFDYYIQTQSTIEDLTANIDLVLNDLLSDDNSSNQTLRQVIAVDFDNTITSEDSYPDTSEIAYHCEKTLKFLHDEGYVLILHTCRTGKYFGNAIQYLKDNNIHQYFSYFNENDPVRIQQYEGDSRKISADYYLEDRQIRGFEGWEIVYNYFKNKKLNRKG